MSSILPENAIIIENLSLRKDRIIFVSKEYLYLSLGFDLINKTGEPIILELDLDKELGARRTVIIKKLESGK